MTTQSSIPDMVTTQPWARSVRISTNGATEAGDAGGGQPRRGNAQRINLPDFPGRQARKVDPPEENLNNTRQHGDFHDYSKYADPCKTPTTPHKTAFH
ncbi:hypothetical protein LRC484719_01910 [Mycobacterium riyadhense]